MFVAKSLACGVGPNIFCLFSLKNDTISLVIALSDVGIVKSISLSIANFNNPVMSSSLISIISYNSDEIPLDGAIYIFSTSVVVAIFFAKASAVAPFPIINIFYSLFHYTT